GGSNFAAYDLILATYGTLRRDIAMLKDTGFNYVILDEAQAIKNASTITAKAARLLNAAHRLALSGTPIENHINELWSLFEFLNPGMLGSVSVFRAYTSNPAEADEPGAPILQKALRPFILRRTKAQVAADLPEKFEETLYCEMKLPQRKAYDELRDFYRNSLLKKIAQTGIKRAQIQILEALLRLRQAACHPGLIDKNRLSDSSAKLEMLLARLDEVLAEDHKVLVFSQFTSLLAIVRHRLDERKIVYEYLDGQTRDRQQRVERFQTDPDCKLFLISLKAGGLGLNLTAAEYVFLLDPWWNPAVEAQAVDRTHRIGQKNRVFAYRLICKDTVEEKVLELQKTKKALADSIITADNAHTRSIGLDELRLLLG
ncbi:MAG: DEAD/DEAH box helicase, partial [Desulfobacteraceae bacterium]